MKKKNLFILVASLTMLLASCETTSVSTDTMSIETISTETDTSIDTNVNTSESTSIEIPSHSIKITYCYPDESIIDEQTYSFKEGEEYSITSPSVTFMSPSKKAIKGIMGKKDLNFVVEYSFSKDNPYCETLEDGQIFDDFYFDEDKYISFTCLASNVLDAYETFFAGTCFKLRPGELSYINKNSSYTCHWDASDAILGKGFTEESLLTYDGSVDLYTFSIDTSKSISVFKNGSLAVYYPAYLPASSCTSSVTIRTFQFVEAIIKDISNNGFKIGVTDTLCPKMNRQLSCLSINYALGTEEVKEIADSLKYVKVNYFDDYNRKIAEPRYAYSFSETVEYSIPSPEFTGYCPTKDVVEGTTNETKTIDVYYDFEGFEHLDTPVTMNRNGIYGWNDQNNWYKDNYEFTGDFVYKAEISQVGAASKDYTSATNGGDVCWRTVLGLIYNSSNSSHYWCSRLDWTGWSNGSDMGNQFSYGSNYFETYNLDLYYVYHDCDIALIYAREGSTVTFTYRIYPNNIAYADKVYSLTYTAKNVTANKLSIAFTMEDAIVTFNSVVY